MLESSSYNSESIYTVVALLCMRDLETTRKKQMSEEHRGNTMEVSRTAQSLEGCRRKCLWQHNKEAQILSREYSLTSRVQWEHRKGLGARNGKGTWNRRRREFGRSKGM